MLEVEISELRREVDGAIGQPPFEDLVRRGRARRRRTVGLGAAALAVVAGGTLMGLGPALQQGTDVPPVERPDEPQAPRSAAEIIDDPTSRLYAFESLDDGLSMAVWARDDCNDAYCPVALAWSEDDWQTRADQLFQDWVEVYPLDDRFLVYPDQGKEFLLTKDDGRIDLAEPGPAAPATDDEVVIDVTRPRGIAMLDPVTGETHGVLRPEGMGLTWIDRMADGRLGAYGPRTSDGVGIYATSDDGGTSWVQHEIPTPIEGAWMVSDGENVVVSRYELDGVELTISTDDGRTWTTVSDMPFNVTECLDLVDGTLMVSYGSHLYRSTDPGLEEYEEVTPEGGGSCIWSDDGVITTIAADRSSALQSADLGTTWTIVDSR